MATLVRAFTEVSDTIAHASSVNRVIDDIYSTINALDSANINSAVINTRELSDQAIEADKVDAELKIFVEVFL